MKTEEQLASLIHADITLEQVQLKKYLINYAVAGSGSPVILLHGASIGWGQWYPNIRALSRHFTVYALDLPGSGQSSKVDFRKSVFKKDFIDTIEEFITKKKLSNFSIMGHSLGGWMALQLGLRKIDGLKSIVLVNPVGFTEYIPFNYRLLAFYPFAKLLSMTALSPTKKNMEKFSRSVMYKKNIKISSIFINYLSDTIIKNNKAHPILLIHRLVRGLKKELIVTTEELERIQIPTLIIAGEYDPQIPIKEIEHNARKIPNGIFEIFKNVGHLAPLENTERFNTIVTSFLLKH